jgi:hypothetical protein
VELSSAVNTATLKPPAADDAEVQGASSVELLAHNPISSSVPEQIKPFAACQVDVATPSSSRQKWKCPPLALKHKPSTDQVMTQIKLPP